MDATQGLERDEPVGRASAPTPMLVARTIRGGFGGKTREALTIDRDGECRCSRVGQEDMVAILGESELGLINSVCESTDFESLPPFVDGPITRSDAYTWTYQVGDHEVSMRDPDRAGDAVPPALRMLDEVVDTVVTAMEGAYSEGPDTTASEADA